MGDWLEPVGRPAEPLRAIIPAERRYFSERSMALLYPERDDVDAAVVELEPIS